MRVAIIGAGPRGLWAAEELASRAQRMGVSIGVDIWEKGELGYGSAYAASQPVYKRLNVTSAIIETHLGAFDDWRQDEPVTSADRHFPPRALVGEFLHASWMHLLQHQSPFVRMEVIKERVRSLLPALSETSGASETSRRDENFRETSSSWTVAGEHSSREYDRVLIATGHAPTWSGAEDDVPPSSPRSPVSVRGLALTFIDTALDLTEGRGGRFRSVNDARENWRVTYIPSGEEPERIVPFSRSGRFMETKVDPDSPLGQLELDNVIAPAKNQVLLAESDDELFHVIARTAVDMLACARAAGLGDSGDRFDEVWRVLMGEDAGDPVEDLRLSLDVAVGNAAPHARWAAGMAFRSLYPAIVQRTSFGGRDQLPGFGDCARRMERVAFGPPVINAAKIIALIDAGIIDTSCIDDEKRARTLTEGFIDCVIAPPGVVEDTLVGDLVARGLVLVPEGHRGAWVQRDGSVPHAPGLAIAGRDTEDVVLGPDTLSRTMHDVIPRWAQTIVNAAKNTTINDPGMHATVPLSARLEPWMVQLAQNPKLAQSILDTYSSPTNVLNPSAMRNNVAELVMAGRDKGVDVRVFYARKANKAITFVDTMRDAGHGVDVASYRELRHVLDRGMPGRNIILSAAIKPDELLQLAIDNGVSISVDNVQEMRRIESLARSSGTTAYCAPRVAPRPEALPATRFGELASVWSTALSGFDRQLITLVGAHVHLHGYAAKDRRTALRETFDVIDSMTQAGHRPSFIDLGGGVPMSYLNSAEEYEHFRSELHAMNHGHRTPFTWKADPLPNTYPFYQSPTRGEWLKDVLRKDIVQGLLARNLRLHLEPGRSILDGCGMILARVAFTKTMSDGTPIVGVEMNRTQCRTTSDDILVDPILIRTGHAPSTLDEQHLSTVDKHDLTASDNKASQGFLVGAYCIEDEVIIRRMMEFPNGVCPGDIIAIPNTAGYFMHILESASHQIPLAKNVLYHHGQVALDLID
ncbi:diaminopimelate decarboxylase [Corynebacterium sp. 4HC-13]|uniref:FAD/NAD(P)-binding protein n=1 Tax=Corynebacterium anserum TaxID=2684406 RepID=UPI00163A16A9|nr:FAD/NAD(P)-binding protein [Corynebacterium anserum]MBC2681189.1 diaminopimelate decarboxylase [Corynebacterium anserum]